MPARVMRSNDDNAHPEAGPKSKHVRQGGAQGEGALRLRKNLLHLHEQVGRAQRLAQRLRLLRARACSRAALMHPDNRGETRVLRQRRCIRMTESSVNRRQRSQRLPAAARAARDLVGAVGKRLSVPCKKLPHESCARRRPSVQRGGRWGARGAAVLHRGHPRGLRPASRGLVAREQGPRPVVCAAIIAASAWPPRRSRISVDGVSGVGICERAPPLCVFLSLVGGGVGTGAQGGPPRGSRADLLCAELGDVGEGRGDARLQAHRAR